MAQGARDRYDVDPTNGNSRGMAALLRSGGDQGHCLCPDDTPRSTSARSDAGAQVSSSTADRRLRQLVAKASVKVRLFHCSTLREPYRIEARRRWELSCRAARLAIADVILYPTCGGTGIIGMWKGLLPISRRSAGSPEAAAHGVVLRGLGADGQGLGGRVEHAPPGNAHTFAAE